MQEICFVLRFVLFASALSCFVSRFVLFGCPFARFVFCFVCVVYHWAGFVIVVLCSRYFVLARYTLSPFASSPNIRLVFRFSFRLDLCDQALRHVIVRAIVFRFVFVEILWMRFWMALGFLESSLFFVSFSS